MMSGLSQLQSRIFAINDQFDFLGIALKVFNYQYDNNCIYRQFVQSLGKDVSLIDSVEKIPFLPVEFFRNHRILTGDRKVEIVFESSGTTGTIPGKHYVSDVSLYEESFLRCFRYFYGDPEEYMFAALLPSYTERSGSSLVYMADRLIKKSGYPGSGFYKENTCELLSAIEKAKDDKRKILLLGVSFALLDLAENRPPDLSGVIVMETGGMKGRRKELIRSELHSILKDKLNIPEVHSEYGMTELLSQAYSKGDGLFHCPPWMKILLRDPQDPLTVFTEPAGTGGINIIDLANINSCSFIATGDLGKSHEDGSFEVIGRFDNSDIRGCNLLVE
jgi:phenylacetate-coenzyme A ligase PaaK-like adenylate-forming protein